MAYFFDKKTEIFYIGTKARACLQVIVMSLVPALTQHGMREQPKPNPQHPLLQCLYALPLHHQILVQDLIEQLAEAVLSRAMRTGQNPAWAGS
jgi:hypothetical protein